MKLVLHQVWTDLRHFRGWLAAFWLTLLVQVALLGTMTAAPDGELLVILSVLLVGLQGLLALLAVVHSIHADPLVGTTGFWMARPLRRSHLFWSKTLWMAGALALPFLGAQSAIWWRLGLSTSQGLLALAEASLYLGSFLFLTAALAAVTANLRQFAMAAIGLLLAMIAWLTLLTMLHFNPPPFDPRAPIGQWEGLQESRLVAAYVVLLGCALFAWIWQATRGGASVSCAATLLGVLMFVPAQTCWRWNFLAPEPKPASSAKVVLLNDQQASSEDRGGQVLWSHFRVEGLPPRYVATVRAINAWFRSPAGPPVRVYEDNSLFGGLFASSRTSQGEESRLVDVVRHSYPPETVWFSQWREKGQRSLPVVGELPPAYREGAPTGLFSGTLSLNLAELVRLADLPVAPGTARLLPGQTITIQDVSAEEEGVVVRLSFTEAALLLSREDRTRWCLPSHRRGSAIVCVVYHPADGEALLFYRQMGYPQERAPFSGASTMRARLTLPYPALRTRLTGMTMEQWLAQLRLQVYYPVVREQLDCSFEQDGYTFRLSRNLPEAKTGQAGLAVIEAVRLPPKPAPAQLEEYLDTVLLHIPESWDQDGARLIERKLTAIGPEGLPWLLRRLPLEERLDYAFVLPVLRHLVKPDHLPLLREALRRDSRLIWVFREKGWETEAQQILREELPEHRWPLPPAALALVAAASDPATYGDLAWHFAHLRGGHDQVLPALRECPGFDLSAAVRRAWQRARLGLASRQGLLLAAAEGGLPEALDLAILELETSIAPARREQILTVLGQLTGYDRDPGTVSRWLRQHLGNFRFNPATGRYLLGDPLPNQGAQ